MGFDSRSNGNCRNVLERCFLHVVSNEAVPTFLCNLLIHLVRPVRYEHRARLFFARPANLIATPTENHNRNQGR